MRKILPQLRVFCARAILTNGPRQPKCVAKPPNQRYPNYYGRQCRSYTPAIFSKTRTGAAELPLAQSEGNQADELAHTEQIATTRTGEAHAPSFPTGMLMKDQPVLPAMRLRTP
jgi:hypothetical protein